MIDGRWAAFKLLSHWKVPGRHIGWLETIAIEIIFLFLMAAGVYERSVFVHSDNKGSIDAHGKGRSGNVPMNASIRRSFATITTTAITSIYEYVPTAANISDPISHGELGSPENSLNLFIVLPNELADILVRVHA